jgi:hypothetical protein
MVLHYITIGMAFLLLVYHQVTTWFNLYPWNETSKYPTKEVMLEGISNGLLMGTGLACLIIGNFSFYHYYPLFYYPFLLIGEIFQWWMPYWSDRFAKSQINFEYDVRFSNTTKLIAHRKGKRTPDANHIILHLITVSTVILVYIYLLFLVPFGI